MKPMGRFLLRWCLILLGGLIALIVIFYAEEDWRGKRAWENCKQELAAKGESVDWKDFIPAPIPDEQNFYEAPKMNDWFVHHVTNNSSDPLFPHLENSETISTNPISETSASNYVAWSAACEPDLDRIRTALKRPSARINGDYNLLLSGPCPNFVSYRIVAQTLAHRARCYLKLGEPEKAMADLTLMGDLNKTLAPNGVSMTLVGGMIHVAIAGIFAETVGYGINSHAWHDSELAFFQKKLEEMEVLRPPAYAIWANHVVLYSTLETVSADEIDNVFFVTPKRNFWEKLKSPLFVFYKFLPRGWIYQNLTRIAAIGQKQLDGFDLASNVLNPPKFESTREEIGNMCTAFSPYNYVAAISAPSFYYGARTVARDQALVTETQIACAFERYHLAHGEYPETLDALEPQYIQKLPHDVIGGKPLHYRREAGDRFVLYSVGWNETDDGGVTVFDDKGSVDCAKGDWVWKN